MPFPSQVFEPKKNTTAQNTAKVAPIRVKPASSRAILKEYGHTPASAKALVKDIEKRMQKMAAHAG